MSDEKPKAVVKEAKKGSMMLDFVLGGTAGAIAKTLCAPIERVKIVL